MQKVKSIWFNGELKPWDEVQVHFFTHTLHYGLGAFEGIRCYRADDGSSAIFRLPEHIRRLFDSAKACLMTIPFTRQQLEQACVEVVRENDLEECYVRPLVWLGEGSLGLGSTTNPVHVGVGAFAWGAYLGEEGQKNGIRCCVSSLSRISHAQHMTRAKISGQYVNSIMANRAAQMSGYDEAILLDGEGNVAEGPGENIFIVRDGELRTPPRSSPILPGITRDTLLTLAREQAEELSIKIIEESFPREDLYLADEAFMTGTAAEVTPLREIDGRVVGSGKPGPVTRALAAGYQDVIRGRCKKHGDWLTPIEVREPA